MGKIDSTVFVGIWLRAYHNSENIKWIAERLGISPQEAAAKSVTLRRKGVKLPKLVGAFGDEVDASQLNSLIDKNLTKSKES